MRITNTTILAVIAAAVSTNAFTTIHKNNVISSNVLSSKLSMVSMSAKEEASATVSSSKEEEEEVHTITPANAVELEGEYLESYENGLKTLETMIPRDKQPMFDLLGHFIKEYVGCAQVASKFASDEEKETIYDPVSSAGRILKGVELAAKHGTKGLPTHYTFDVSHNAMRGDADKEDGNDYDFYKFGCDFFRPCMNLEKSKVLGGENVKKAFEQIKNGENVVFLSNHQSEADPQVVSVCLGELFENSKYEDMAADITYVAGHKVTTDPLAIPFSMGRNLICIHSKKHIDTDPETKGTKQRENLRAMSAMLGKLKEGGCCLWVAPGGGRDRRDLETGDIPVAPFDDKTVDMFRLMGNKSKKPTHYYPMSILSYDLCPPPDYVVAGVGEERNVRYVPVGVMVGDELIEDKEGMASASKKSRQKFTEIAMQACQDDYQELINNIY